MEKTNVKKAKNSTVVTVYGKQSEVLFCVSFKNKLIPAIFKKDGIKFPENINL